MWRDGRRAWLLLLLLLAAPGLVRLTGADVLAAPEATLYDLASRTALSRAPVQPGLVTVVVDDRGLADLGERWPLERSTWARFVSALDELRPAVIAIDVLFDQPAPRDAVDLADDVLVELESAGFEGHAGAAELRGSLERRLRNLDGDRLLAEAMAHSGRVVLGEYVHHLPGGGERLLTSVAGLRTAARSSGAMNVVIDDDDVVRRYPFVLPGGRPSLALAAALAAEEDPGGRSSWRARAASDDNGAPLVRYPDLAELVVLRFEDVLAGRLDARARGQVHGATVFVGAAAAGVGDEHGIPTGERLPGVMLHAAAANGLLAEDGTVAQSGLAAWLGLAWLLLLLLALDRLCVWARALRYLTLGAATLLALHGIVTLAAAELGGVWLGLSPGVLALVVGATVEAIARYVALIRERRELERSEAAARESAELKDSLLSMVSHELRTPLTSIKGSLGLLAGGAVGEAPPPMRRLVQLALDNSERLLRMVDDILDMARLEARRMTYRRAPSDIAALLDRAVGTNLGFAAEHGVRLALEPVAIADVVDVDADRVAQVMANLISNAVKFSPEAGTVTVSARRAAEGRRVRIGVTDEGPGIPEESRAQIFEKFSQARNSGSGRRKGTGLGLSIARAIVEDHDGRIGFDTEVGAGTTFWFELPLLGPPTRQALPEQESGHRRS